MQNKLIKTMKLRSEILSRTRNFFDAKNYTEADIPLLTPAVIPEAAIELFKTEQIKPYGEPRELYLLPSPEYYLKQLIAAGSGNIYSISRSFRNSEQLGKLHNPEFTMLEYYTMGADYMDSIKLTEDFITDLLSTAGKAKTKLEPPFTSMTMTEVFDRYASFDLSKHCTGELSPEEEIIQLHKRAEAIGLKTSAEDTWEELFNLIFVHQIEPALPADKALVIYNYPSAIPALAKPASEKGRLERWELYAGGVELANCYSEETNYTNIKNFFKNESNHKESALVPVKTDNSWMQMYKNDYPCCSGTALGIDRLMMILTDAESIGGVILFPFSDML